jgi:hypothetical protein
MSLNRFAYADGDPIDKNDPFGLAAEVLAKGAGWLGTAGNSLVIANWIYSKIPLSPINGQLLSIIKILAEIEKTYREPTLENRLNLGLTSSTVLIAGFMLVAAGPEVAAAAVPVALWGIGNTLIKYGTESSGEAYHFTDSEFEAALAVAVQEPLPIPRAVRMVRPAPIDTTQFVIPYDSTQWSKP